MDLDPLAIVRRRLHEQRLTENPLATPAEAVSWLGAMQAQEFAEAKWSISERTGGTTDAEVEAAFDRGEILRTHVMRPTWHFVAPADIRWLLALTAARVHVANGYMYRQEGLDDDLLRRSGGVIEKALSEAGPLTRLELAERLGRAGIEAERFRLAYILMWAELEGLICSGPRRGKQHTYALLDERVKPAPQLTREEALAELTRRYFTSHGPARVKDFTQWSGLKVADANVGLGAVGDELETAADTNGVAWFAAPDSPVGAKSGGALLLSMYDEIVSGYRDLRIVYAREPPREGLLSRPILIDGRTVGSWRRVLDGKGAVVDSTLFKRLSSSERGAIAQVTERFGAFLGAPVKVRMELVTG